MMPDIKHISDEHLVMEILRRGYSISKPADVSVDVSVVADEIYRTNICQVADDVRLYGRPQRRQCI